MKKILGIVLIIIGLILMCVACFGEAETTASQNNMKTDATTTCIEQLSELENITVDAVDIFIEYIPYFDEFIKIENDGAHSFNLFFSNHEPLYAITFAAGEYKNNICCIMTSEKDYDARIRYYDVKVENGKLVNRNTDSIVTEPIAPSFTLGQKNAIKKAESYLKHMHFSKTGLIKQLEFEKFSTEDAEFAVNYITVDWKEQAAGKAQDYLNTPMSFSADGLRDQLEYEGFTSDEIEYAISAIGY